MTWVIVDDTRGHTVNEVDLADAEEGRYGESDAPDALYHSVSAAEDDMARLAELTGNRFRIRKYRSPGKPRKTFLLFI